PPPAPAPGRLYRGLGWELSGVHGGRVVPTRSLAQLKAGSADAVRRAERGDLPAIAACYARVAPRYDGFLDRPDWFWDRSLGSRWDERFVYVVDGDEGEVDGYV